jgi:hypothetical protein
MLAQPAHALPLGPNFQVRDWLGLGETATQDWFPKLGIKSWRDSGGSRVIARGMPLRPVIEGILGARTWQQSALAGAWIESGSPLYFYLYPFVDFTNIGESRWLASARGSRFVSGCERGHSAPLFGKALRDMQALAAQVALAIGHDPQLVGLGLLPSGEIRLVEVNPSLRPAEVKALLSA